MKSPAGYAEAINFEENLRAPRIARAKKQIEKPMSPLEEKYPYGHPFWLGKPQIEDFEGDFSLLLLDLFQDGHCFLNGFQNAPCHPDSYMTILDYAAVDKAFKIIQDEYNLPKEKWLAFCDFWVDHINKQPITCLLGLHIRRKFENEKV